MLATAPMQTVRLTQGCHCCCRVPVPGQADPIVCITCISHASSQATAKPAVAAPAAELQLEDLAGEEGDLEGGLEGSLQSLQSAEAAASDIVSGQWHRLFIPLPPAPLLLPFTPCCISLRLLLLLPLLPPFLLS